jgi:hypothetical protein
MICRSAHVALTIPSLLISGDIMRALQTDETVNVAGGDLFEEQVSRMWEMLEFKPDDVLSGSDKNPVCPIKNPLRRFICEVAVGEAVVEGVSAAARAVRDAVSGNVKPQGGPDWPGVGAPPGGVQSPSPGGGYITD